MLAGGLEIPAAAKATGPAVKVMSGLTSGLRKRLRERRDAASFRQTLGLDRQPGVSYRVACEHPLFQIGSPHPDDLDAFSCILGSDLPRWDEVTPIPDEDSIPAGFSENFVLIGSPESESFTRLLFGYEHVRGGSRYLGGTLDLPFRWQEDPRTVETTYSRFVPNAESTTSRPNWPVLDQRNGGSKSIYPRLHPSGFLKTDLLLITKIPNYTSKEALQSGRSIVSIAGAHGTATRAIELVLRDRAVLASLASQVATLDAFQVLVQVDDIDHDVLVGSRGRRVTPLEVEPVHWTDAQLVDARKTLSKRQPKWRQGLSRAGESWRTT